ncbi:FMN reductase [Pseudomonas agarici]|uniref:FMN reductase n=1 Tax=Pseudomonas agarici TaxID=46677 RepID=A0A0X1T7M8_PSEAA|nr:NAD(P)H-dependent oxidoreductase [Pseudomonas agarici]AMB88106.1 FMN reductase [Pseudomonas agarici]NWB92996.1 NAD(P)H-dependent oxidoreductase [Pseudomonas agarici]NWC09263.1 NAD(P)H-dependent oxidoreductase [Pseudomonas agarici]SEK30084.1 NAD(P)H-dependent FMN reductase [Pseudomonas agarici]
MKPIKILAFSGSVRRASLNVKLLNLAVAATLEHGAQVTHIDLRKFPLPIYDGDLEAESGVPENAQTLRELLLTHDGLLIASPEYNGSVTALLKNTLDWCSRPANGVDGLAPFRGKAVGLMSASLSPFGGLRGIIDLRGIMAKLGAIVLSEDVALPTAQNAFDSQDAFVDVNVGRLVHQFTSNLIGLSTKLRSTVDVSGVEP